MDEAAAKLRMEMNSVPEELDEMDRLINSWRLNVRPSSAKTTSPNVEQLSKEIAELKEQETSYKAKWQSEKNLSTRSSRTRQEIEHLKFEAEKAEREGDYGRVAEIRYGKIQALKSEIEGTQEELNEMQGRQGHD